jgi:hypothetical protein
MRRLILALAIAATPALPALAHHGWGSYDATKTLTIKGPVLTLKFENPHATVTLKAEDAKVWTVTLAPVSRMINRGATAEMVAVGQTITAVGYASTVEKDEMRAERIIAGDKTIEMR